MSVSKLLEQSALFFELTPEQIEQIAALGHEATYDVGDIVISEGAPTHEMYVICSGAVEVIAGAAQDEPGMPQVSAIVRLGQGQVFGEMALVDSGARSATVRCSKEDTVLYVIPHKDFWALCEGDHHIGFIVMRNIAADLSFKLRVRNLQERMAGGRP